MKFLHTFLLAIACLVSAELLHLHAQSAGKAPLPPLPDAVKPISKNELLKAGCLSAFLLPGSKSNSSLQVASYTMTIDGVGRDPSVSILSESDSFPSRILKFVRTSYAGTRVIFSKIILYSDSSGAKQKLYPPSLAFRIGED